MCVCVCVCVSVCDLFKCILVVIGEFCKALRAPETQGTVQILIIIIIMIIIKLCVGMWDTVWPKKEN